MTGKTISHYRILEQLGEGGMGAVYRAEDTSLGRTVALKFLTREALGDEEIRARLLREAQVSAALDHPNICHVYGIHEEDGETFIAMAYVDGPSLADKIKQRPLPLQEAIEIALQMTEALQEAHEQGVVHRDIKPQNVMLDAKGRVKILDFGLAQLAGRSRITREGTTLGTALYMAPEQMERGAVDRRADIWAVGITLYEMLIQRTPFESDYEQSVAYAILNHEPEPITARRGGLPIELDQILRKALAKAPGNRYQHADDLAVDLRRVLDTVSGGTDSRASVTAEAVATRPKGGWLPIAAGVALAVLGTVAVMRWISRPAGDIAPPTESVLTSYQGRESWPSFSPDGSQVAYSRHLEGQENGDIYVEVVGSRQPIQVTSGPANDYSPAWSPDGRSIAFARFGDGSPLDTKIILVPALGGTEHPLLDIDCRFATTALSWSPDGERLAFAGRSDPDGPVRIGLFTLENRDVDWLTSPKIGLFGDSMPSFLPSGERLAFVRREGPSSGWNVFVLSLSDGFEPQGEPEQVTEFELHAGSPAWTPDGKHILFTGLREAGQAGIWSVPASGGGEPRLLWRTGRGRGTLAVSQGVSVDTQVAFSVQGEMDTDTYRVDLAGPSRGEAVPIVSTTMRDTNGRYSPDGRRIAYYTGEPMRNVWVCDADGGNNRQITDIRSAVVGPLYWSPDSRKIVFHSRPSGAADLYVVDAETGELEQLTDNESDDVMPAWSRDGKWIYFGSNRTGDYGLWRMPAQGGEAVQVLDTNARVIEESWDGRTLYFLAPQTRDFMQLSLTEEGASPSVLLAGSDGVRSFRVGPSGLYFTKDRPRSGAATVSGMLCLFDTREKKVKELFPVKGYLSSVASDESSVLTVYGAPPGSDLKMITIKR